MAMFMGDLSSPIALAALCALAAAATFTITSSFVQTMEAGRMFGEIAFFSPSRRRTATARCLDDCLVLSVNEHTVRELYYQNPSFGFELVGLVAARLSADSARLSADVDRLKAQLAQHQTAN